MNNEEVHIDEIIFAKALANECSDEERKVLETWLKESEQNRSEFEAYREVWKLSDVLMEDDFDVDSAWINASSKMDDFEEQKGSYDQAGRIITIDTVEPNNQRWLSWAAMIAIVASIGAGFWYNGQVTSTPSLSSWTQYASAETTKTINLDDGSTVVLAANSNLKVSDEFAHEMREVKLEGKAFFDVAKNASKPFIIRTNLSDIEVLGTSFEVNTVEQNTVEVEVQEGLVSVVNNQSQTQVKVAAGQNATVSSEMKEILLGKNKPSAFFWKEKVIKFKRTALKQVAETLSETHGLKVEFENEAIGNCELTATFRDDDHQTIMDVISTTLGLQLSKKNEVFILNGTGC